LIWTCLMAEDGSGARTFLRYRTGMTRTLCRWFAHLSISLASPAGR
jgi:hypothetical protein